jgi:hypothetical protein
MGKAGAKFSEVKELLMKDEEFKTEYEKLKPRYDVDLIKEFRGKTNLSIRKITAITGLNKDKVNRILKS